MTMIKTLALGAAGVIGALLASCGGSDDSDPSGTDQTLIGFVGSACKKESRSGALTAAEAYAGLQCIRWKPSAGVQIELVNFEGACGAQWSGSASATESGVELRVANPGCLLAACGSCMYDWAFDVNADMSKDLPLTIVTDPCPGEQPPESVTATLPLASSSQGEVCRYASYGGLGWQASALGQCGQAFMPCRASGGMCDMGSATTPCDAGLECADGASATEQVCHSTCTGDADCALPGILGCQSGLCRPVQTW